MQNSQQYFTFLRTFWRSSSRLASLREFSKTAPTAGTEEIASALKADVEGMKSILHRLLENAEKPLSSAEMWAIAETEGLKSKRFMKQMLQQMKKRGHIKAVPMGGGKKAVFGYLLPDSRAAEVYANSKKTIE